ncbi:ABC transporter substrate-binding protein [Histidinibacterium lentulum]|uniref:Extracellular solute-binding protein n=1 Tax=Histidinibacterium lentulum TaxID=2480588 RepID=A0A3N2QUY9_9RHOB|nr:extracellular solute-binding protein [Histidinibacterium lentulum]ROT99048.1 extracellular solute-binding protein [Histidinibacterium lentulum]
MLSQIPMTDSGVGRRSGRLRARTALPLVAALSATTFAAAPAMAQEDQDVTELSVWFAREYTVPSRAQLEAFEAETGITLTVDVQPNDNLFSQLIRMRDAGLQLPDVVHLDGFLGPVVATAGVVVPIQDIVDAWAADDPEGFAEIYDSTWSDGTWEGELYGMANTASMEEVYFRSDWLAEVGVTGAPATWDEVLDFARATKEARPDAVAFGWWAQRGNGANAMYSMMAAMGVPFDGSVPDLQSEAGLYMIDFLQTLAREELVSSDVTAWNDDNMRGGYVASNIGMMLDSAPTSGDLADAGLVAGENFRIVPMPTSRTGESEDGVLVSPARTFFVTAGAVERGAKDEAGLVLRFLMDPEVALEVMLAGTDPHRTDAVLGDPEAVAQWMPVWEEANIEAFRNQGSFPVDLDFPSAEDVVERFNEFVMSNPEMDPAAIAEEWQANFEAIRD